MANDIGATALTAVRALLGDAQSSVRYAGSLDMEGTVDEATCTGIERMQMQNEEGLYDGAEGIIRYKLSDEPASWRVKTDNSIGIMGQPVEIKLPKDEEWDDALKVRVVNRHMMGGAVRLNVVGENEDI